MTRQFCYWITEPEMVSFEGVRLEMNSLRVKKDDVIRPLSNEPAAPPKVASALGLQGLAAGRVAAWIRDWQSLNHC